MPGFLKTRFVLLGLLVNIVCAGYSQEADKGSCIDLGPDEFFIKMHEANLPVLIDTRTGKEFRKERIDGAVLAQNSKILHEITDTLDFDHPVFIYCEYDSRSREAGNILAEKGFRKVYNLEGGILEWERAGYDIDKKRH